jgi:hypothetical protein
MVVVIEGEDTTFKEERDARKRVCELYGSA